MATEPGGVGQQWGEALHPPVHRDVIHLDITLDKQLLVPGARIMRQPEPASTPHPPWPRPLAGVNTGEKDKTGYNHPNVWVDTALFL